MSSERDLAGVRVVVTRAAHQARRLLDLFAARGARCESLPLLEIAEPVDPRPLERAASELALYDWIVFTSANAASALLDRTGGALPPRLQVGVIGRATAQRLHELGIEPDLIAGERTAEGLARDLAPHVRRRRRVLVPQAEDARRALEDLLTKAGAEVVRVDAYRKRIPAQARDHARRLFASQPWGWVTFTSPSTVRHLMALLEERWSEGSRTLLAASIGPVTSAALLSRGVEPAAEAASPSDQDLVEAVAGAVRNRRAAST